MIDISDINNVYNKQIIKASEQLISLNIAVDLAKTPQEKKNLQRQIDALDNQIDRLVYELYDLTEDEIKIVEESVKWNGLPN